MEKKRYSGLDLVLIPFDEGEIVATSGCVITSVQYYVNGTYITGQCDPEDTSYNVNWYGMWS